VAIGNDSGFRRRQCGTPQPKCDSLLLPRAEHLTNVIKISLPLDWLISLESEPFAVAIAVLPTNTQVIDQLWDSIDKDSWVAPQLVAVAFLRDLRFTDHASKRLRSWGDSIKQSSKAPAALVRLIELLPKAPDSLKAAASAPTLIELLNNDVDSSGSIAEEWLRSLREKLIELGVTASDGTLLK
jgi:hypothetical protein